MSKHWHIFTLLQYLNHHFLLWTACREFSPYPPCSLWSAISAHQKTKQTKNPNSSPFDSFKVALSKLPFYFWENKKKQNKRSLLTWVSLPAHSIQTHQSKYQECYNNQRNDHRQSNNWKVLETLSDGVMPVLYKQTMLDKTCMTHSLNNTLIKTLMYFRQ